MSAEISRTVSNAVTLVNQHAGAACVRLQFTDDPIELDFIASSASISGDEFQFCSGFETYSGNVSDLKHCKVEVIGRPS